MKDPAIAARLAVLQRAKMRGVSRYLLDVNGGADEGDRHSW